MNQHVVIVGSGISGLAAGHRLLERCHASDKSLDVTLLEASDRPGGIIDTVKQGDYLLERGPDNFITNKPWAMDLVKRLGIEDELIRTRKTDAAGRKVGGARIYWQGRFYPIPDGFQMMGPKKLLPLVLSPYLSMRGKWRALKELGVPAIHRKADLTDESLSEFARRRFGDEVFQKLIGPLIAGIYTADPDQLSLRASLPQFLDMEEQSGSVIRGLRKQSKSSQSKRDQGVRYSLFVSFKKGMRFLIDTLAERIQQGSTSEIRYGTAVQEIYRQPKGFQIVLRNGQHLRCDRVIVATKASVAGAISRPLDTRLGAKLGEIKTASSAVVKMAFDRSQFPSQPDCYGFIVPKQQGTRMLALTYNSVKYEGRAPEDQILLRSFWGGALDESVLDRTDESLTQLALESLVNCVGIKGKPRMSRVFRYERSMPQYSLGHLDRVAQIRDYAEAINGYELIGNSYQGVGIPDCVRDAEAAADRVFEAI